MTTDQLSKYQQCIKDHPSPSALLLFLHPLLLTAARQMNAPEPTLSCTFTWDMVYNSIEHEDSEALDGCPLPTDLAVTRYLPNTRGIRIKWIIDQISAPLESGRQFWFHFEEGFQESRPNTLFLGELSIIHTFFGVYALVEISPILHIDWDYGWIAEEGNLYWMYMKDLILSSEEQQMAQRALLQNPTFSLFNTQTSDEE